MSQTTELVVIIRPSFMKFCQDGCRSALFNHMLYWIAQKAKGESAEKILRGEVYWYASNDELTDQMAGAWSHCKVQQEVKALVDAGLIGVARNPKWGADRTKHFYIGREQGKRLLEMCEQHQIDLTQLGLSMDVLHYLNLVDALPKSSQSITCIQVKDGLNLGDGLPKSSEAITKDSSKRTPKDTNKERETEPLPASPSPVHPSSSVSSQKPEEARWNARVCRDHFYELSGLRPRLTKQLAEDERLAAELCPTTNKTECTAVFTHMKADPYWKPKNFPFQTFVKHFSEYLHAPPPSQARSTTPPSKGSLGGPPSERISEEENTRRIEAMLAKAALHELV